MVARVWDDQHDWIPHPNSFRSPINLAGRAATAAAETGPQHCGSQERDTAQKMQLPGSEVGCVVRETKLEGVCMLSLELGINYRGWREQGGDKEIRQEPLSYCVSMGSGCMFAAGAGRVSKKERSSAVRREAQQEGLQQNLSVATGRTQLQNATRTYLVWVSFCQAALPGKNAPGDLREQLELHSMERTGTEGGSSCTEHSPP